MIQTKYSAVAIVFLCVYLPLLWLSNAHYYNVSFRRDNNKFKLYDHTTHGISCGDSPKKKAHTFIFRDEENDQWAHACAVFDAHYTGVLPWCGSGTYPYERLDKLNGMLPWFCSQCSTEACPEYDIMNSTGLHVSLSMYNTHKIKINGTDYDVRDALLTPQPFRAPQFHNTTICIAVLVIVYGISLLCVDFASMSNDTKPLTSDITIHTCSFVINTINSVLIIAFLSMNVDLTMYDERINFYMYSSLFFFLYDIFHTLAALRQPTLYDYVIMYYLKKPFDVNEVLFISDSYFSTLIRRYIPQIVCFSGYYHTQDDSMLCGGIILLLSVCLLIDTFGTVSAFNKNCTK